MLLEDFDGKMVRQYTLLHCFSFSTDGQMKVVNQSLSTLLQVWVKKNLRVESVHPIADFT
jgi:hypothetical protein